MTLNPCEVFFHNFQRLLSMFAFQRHLGTFRCSRCLPPVFQSLPFPLLDNIRVMVIIWRLRGNIIRTALCWIVWHSVDSPQHTCMSSSYRSNRLGFSHWDPYAVHGCWLPRVIVTWWSGFGGIQAWSRRPTGFLQCFDTVGLVIWPVKIVPEMTYNVLSDTINPTHSVIYLPVYSLLCCWCLE